MIVVVKVKAGLIV